MNGLGRYEEGYSGDTVGRITQDGDKGRVKLHHWCGMCRHTERLMGGEKKGCGLGGGEK